MGSKKLFSRILHIASFIETRELLRNVSYFQIAHSLSSNNDLPSRLLNSLVILLTSVSCHSRKRPLQKEYLDDPECAVCVCVCVCPSQAIPGPKTIEVIIIKVGRANASDMVMYHVLIILTLNFIQGHTYVNHENHKCSIISERVQAIFIKFAAKMVRLKVDISFSVQ